VLAYPSFRLEVGGVLLLVFMGCLPYKSKDQTLLEEAYQSIRENQDAALAAAMDPNDSFSRQNRGATWAMGPGVEIKKDHASFVQRLMREEGRQNRYGETFTFKDPDTDLEGFLYQAFDKGRYYGQAAPADLRTIQDPKSPLAQAVIKAYKEMSSQ
jgi:hypothetical protein